MASFKFDSKVVSVSLGSEVKSDDESVVITDVALPSDSPARVKVLKAEGKKWYLTIVYHKDTEKPFALFCHTNHSEKSATTSDAVCRLLRLASSKGILDTHIKDVKDKTANEPNVSKLTRTISLLLRHGVSIKSIVATLDSMEDIFVGSFLFQIKKFLGQYIKDGEDADEDCPECGGRLVFSEGCLCCKCCGHSKCS